MYFDLWVPLTISKEMNAQGFLWVLIINVSQVFIYSFFDSSESLTYILFIAGFACDAVNDIRTSTTDVFHGVVGVPSVVAGDGACFVE